MVLNTAKSSGDHQLDLKVLEETILELEKGCAAGPIPFISLEKGAVISRRFPLVQGAKTRKIDDFSVSGVNDSALLITGSSCTLLMLFVGMVRSYFEQCEQRSLSSDLVCKTYDLKSAYRQVPIRCGHLRYGFFLIFNAERQSAEIHQLRTLPFGETHSVYSFQGPFSLLPPTSMMISS